MPCDQIDCNQGRNCTCTPDRIGGIPRRTCAELGVCQSRTPACEGCTPRLESADWSRPSLTRAYLADLAVDLGYAAAIVLMLIVVFGLMGYWSMK